MIRFLHAILCILFFGFTSRLFAAESIAGFFPLEVEANGIQESLMTIPQQGRYSIQVDHSLGTSIRIIDKMTGPGQEMGEPGVKNGRLDVFLEKGEYKLQMSSPKNGSGKIIPRAYVFEEQNSTPLQLVQGKLLSTQISDLQQRSYWLHIESQQWIYIEAAAKHLSDLRVWKDGRWLINDNVNVQTIDPDNAKPLNYIQLKLNLTPGMYRVTAYGDVGIKWAQNDESNPLYIRSGLSKLAPAGRQTNVMSPFGIDYWLVPSSTNYIELELAQRDRATLHLAYFDYGDEIKNYLSSDSIYKNSKHSKIATDLNAYVNRDEKPFILIAVKRQADKNYTLQYFDTSHRVSAQESGLYWISTLQSGKAGDHIDASFVLVKQPVGKKTTLIDHSSITLSQKMGWKRKINFTQELSLYVDVKDNGAYKLNIDKGKAQYRFEPFFIHKPRNYTTPEFKLNEEVWNLTTGLHVLTIKPFGNNKGVKSLKIVPTGKNDSELDFIQNNSYKVVNLEAKENYSMQINQQGTNSGLIVRALPVNLREALPIVLQGLQKIELPVLVPEDGQIQVMDEDRVEVPYSIEPDVEMKTGLKQGKYQIQIVNTSNATRLFTLQFIPSLLSESSPLPPFDMELIRKIPPFPRLVNGIHKYMDLNKLEQKYFEFNVEKSQLIHLQSTGLLDTQGILRTHTSTQLNDGQNYASGRNFILQEYLRPGSYQLQISARGNTHGHLGVVMENAVVKPGGQLPLELPARMSLKAGQAAEYWISIEQTAKYRINALGLHHNWRIRLEDEDGWPLVTPGQKNEIQVELKKGKYRIIILPQSVDARVLVMFKQVETEAIFNGTGPHNTPLNSIVSHNWIDKENTNKGDQWHFQVNADTHIEIKIASRMQGTLSNLDSGETIANSIQKQWNNKIATGRYKLVLQPLRSTSYFPYTFHINTVELLLGQRREVTLPVSIPLSLNDERMVNLYSFGDKDVVGILYSADGQLLARSDDSHDDWNFQITKKLKPGFYRLDLNSTQNENSDGVVVVFDAPTQIENDGIKLSELTQVSDSALHTYPITLTKQKSLLTIASQSEQRVEMRLEKFDDEWRSIDEKSGSNPFLVAVVASTHKYRLLVWSTEGRGAPIEFIAAEHEINLSNEKELKNGLKSNDVSIFKRSFGITEVKLNSPGIFKFVQPTQKIWVATQSDRGFEALESTLTVHAKSIWLLAEDNVEVAANRIILEKNNPLKLPIESADKATLDIAKFAGPVLVKAVSRYGQVGLGFEGQVPYGRYLQHTSGVSISVRSKESETNRLLLWNASENKTDTLHSTVELISLKEQGSKILLAGQNFVDIEALSTLNLKFNNPSAGLQLSIPPYTAVSWQKDNQTLGIDWADIDAKSMKVTELIDSVTLFNTQLNPVTLNIKVFQGDHDLPVLTQENLFKDFVEFTGHQIIRLDPGQQDVYLHLPGRENQFTFITDDGFITRNIMDSITKKGRLDIDSNPGSLVAWVQHNEPEIWSNAQEFQVLWPQTIKIQAEISTLLFHANEAKYLHVSAKAPMIIRLKQGLLPAEIKLLKDNTILNWLLPAGESNIQIQNIHKGPLFTTLDIDSSPIIALKEGLGDKYRMSPGGSRMFEFSLSKSATVGIGIQSQFDVLECKLFDKSGNQLGHGKVQMSQLEAGDYLMSVDSKPTNPSVEFRPILVGSVPPTGVPVEQVERYMKYHTVSE